MRRKVNSGFSFVTMRRVAIIFFEIGVVKVARQFMIISLFKNCA